MKTSSKTATTASTSTIANALSKSAAVTFFVTSLFGVVYSNSYELETIGSGNANNDDFGFDIALSGNGQFMAVGSPLTNIAEIDGGTLVENEGMVYLYGKNGTDWDFFQQLDGLALSPAAAFGRALDLSDDGFTLAIGGHYYTYIYTYSNITSTYSLFYTTPDWIYTHEVSLSGDGRVFGVTSGAFGSTIFERVDNGFQQRGPRFTVYGRGNTGIAMNHDGTIVAIGGSDAAGSFVGVFEWKDDNNDGSMEWTKMGSDITTDGSFGQIGCVSITNDGLTVAVGGIGLNDDKTGLNNRGFVRVLNHDPTDATWNQLGDDLLGDVEGDLFTKTTLSSNGTYLAVGAYGTGDGYGNYVKTFKKIGNNYEMFGEKVTSGNGLHELFGYAVDMTADGAEIAIGAKGTSNIANGAAYLLVPNALIQTTNPSAVPSTSPSFSPTAAVSKTEFGLTFLSENSTIDFAGNSPGKEIIIKSLISDKAPRDSFEQTIWVGADCKSKFVDEYPDDTTLVTISNNQTLDVVEGKSKQVTSEIDIDTLNIASKGVHTNSTKSIYSEYEDNGVEKAKVEFCIRTDYGKVNITTSEGVVESSINFYKVKIAINFVLEFGFTSSNVTIKEEEAGEAQQAAVITSNLEACDCPADADSTTDCYETDPLNAKTYNQNDILSVCVYDPNGNSIITSFKDVELGNGQISTQVIDPDGRPTALASVSKLNEEMAIVNTRIVSAFFDTSDGTLPAPVNVKGTAVIGFKTSGARKLTSVGLKGARNARKLQDEEAGGEGTFDVEVVLSDDEQVDGSQGFDMLEYGVMSFVMTAMIPLVLL